MKATEYLKRFPAMCTFVEYGPGRCEDPAVAVYVSDDYKHIANYMCAAHAFEAEKHGDGPVFWINAMFD